MALRNGGKEKMTKNREILFMDPVCTHNIWGGERLWGVLPEQERSA